MNSLFATSNDLTRIAFDVSGARAPILLLHRGGGSRVEGMTYVETILLWGVDLMRHTVDEPSFKASMEEET